VGMPKWHTQIISWWDCQRTEYV